jgi:hypothetical protein
MTLGPKEENEVDATPGNHADCSTSHVNPSSKPHSPLTGHVHIYSRRRSEYTEWSRFPLWDARLLWIAKMPYPNCPPSQSTSKTKRVNAASMASTPSSEPDFRVICFQRQRGEDAGSARRYHRRKTHQKSKTGCLCCKVKRVKVPCPLSHIRRIIPM